MIRTIVVNRHLVVLATASICFMLAGCVSYRLPLATPGDPVSAGEILAASMAAHGGEKAFDAISELQVGYEGKWSGFASSLQPVLSDPGFRIRSDERLSLLPEIQTEQIHHGPAGIKTVFRKRPQIRIERNGIADTDPEALAAAALVVDVYEMLLLGPFYFRGREHTITHGGTRLISGRIHDVLLATVRPGFGESEEDRLALFIDRDSKLLRRVHFSIDGLESTRGAEVDVTFDFHTLVAGILWPTEFDERIRVPFDLPAHRWRMKALTVK